MIEVLKQALEALEFHSAGDKIDEQIITSLRQAIAELESQETVALTCCGYRDASAVKWNPLNDVVQCHNCGQTYAHPPQHTEQEPVALTDDEIYDAAFSAYCRGENSRELFRIMWNSRLTCSIGWDRDELKFFARNIAAIYTHPREKNQ